METLFLVISTLFYAGGTVGYLIYLFRDRESIHRMCLLLLLIGVLFHTSALVLRSYNIGQLAVTNSQEAMSFFALVIVVTYIAIQLRLRLRILGSFVSPLAVIFMLMSSLLPSNIVPKSELFKSGWVILHVTALFLANALFALAFSVAVMYLLQERQIKSKQFGFLYLRLPPLDRLDTISHYCLVIGFPLMTGGLVAGFAYAAMVWKTPWSWDPKEVLSLVTWLIYAVLIHERLAVGWRGRKAAWLAIFGFSAVLITFLGVNLFLKGHHSVYVR